VDAISVKTGGGAYTISFGGPVETWLRAELGTPAPGRFALLLVDENVFRGHGERLLAAFEALSLPVLVIEVPAGESSKSLEQYGRLCDQVLRCGPDRTTPLVSCGGGVTGDVAGFVAATVLRGLPLYQLPTTTLSQADSSVGGKVGLNHGSGKNLLGAFYQPRAVLIDPAFLSTLDRRNFRAGLYESLKMGLIMDERLHSFMVGHWDRVEAGEQTEVLHVLHRSCLLKARVVEEDEREYGPRRVLNFGHTVGHVLEHLSDGGLRHGEAVAWGMAAAIRLSATAAGLDRNMAAGLETFLLERPGLPRPEMPEREAFLRVLERDKKRRGRAIDLVLLRTVGQTLISRDIDPEEIWQAARAVLEAGGRRKAHSP